MFSDYRKTILFANNNKSKNNLSIYAINYKNNIIANGGSISDSILTIFDNQFFKPAALNGKILNQADRINIYKGQNNEIAALTSVVNNVFVINVNGVSWSNTNGFSSNTVTRYLNLNQTINSLTYYTKNDNSFGMITTGNTGQCRMGVQQGGSFYSNIALNSTTAINGSNNSTVGTMLTGQSLTGIYVFGAKRINSSTEQIIFKDSNTITRNANSVSLPAYNMFETCQNFNGNSNSNDLNSKHYASFTGSSQFDAVAFKTLCLNLWNALGV